MQPQIGFHSFLLALRRTIPHGQISSDNFENGLRRSDLSFKFLKTSDTKECLYSFYEVLVKKAANIVNKSSIIGVQHLFIKIYNYFFGYYFFQFSYT
jgi:hypothetical protein